MTAGAGNGLYTTRSYKRNQIITEYCGPLIDYQEARERRGRQQDSHIRCLSYGTQCIDGLKQPEQGQGGASFANDARDTHLNNSRFYSKYVLRPSGCRSCHWASRYLGMPPASLSHVHMQLSGSAAVHITKLPHNASKSNLLDAALPSMHQPTCMHSPAPAAAH